MKWLSDIKIGSKPLVSDVDFDASVSQLKAAKSEVPSIDNVFKDLPYAKIGDEIHINDVRFRDMEVKFRKGEIRSALNDAKISNTIPASDEAALRNTLKQEAPDIDISELNQKIDTAKRYHSDLDVVAKDGAELESKLSTSSKEKTKAMYSKIVAGIAIGGTAAGLFTAMIVSGEVFDDIAKANNSRNGCFLVYKNSQTVACKLPSRSCGYGSNGSPPCSTEYVNKTKYNINLMVNHFFQSNDETAISAMKDRGIEMGTDPENPATYSAEFTLSKPENISLLTDFYNEKYPNITDIPFNACDVSGIAEGCVSCDTTAATNDVKYATTELFDGNITYSCVQNSSIIDTLTDIATNLGVDLFTASGDSLSGSFQGNFFLTIMVILALIFGIAIVMKLVPKKSSTRDPLDTPGVTRVDNMAPPPMTSQQPIGGYQQSMII